MLRSRSTAVVVYFSFLVACARAPEPALDAHASRAVSYSVSPASQEVQEGRNANWSGTIAFGQGTDGLPSSIAWDYDADGTSDHVLCGPLPATDCRQNCQQTGVLGEDDFSGPGGYVGFLLVADLDVDGDVDHVLVRDDYYSGMSWSSYLTGGGSFAGSYYGVHPYFAAIGDVTADGIPDILFTEYPYSSTTGTGRVFAGDGLGGFESQALFSFGNGGAALAVGDLDGDGFDEVAADYRHSEVVGGFPVTMDGVIVLTSASGTLQPLVSAVGPYSLQSVAFGDVGGEGNVDVLTIGIDGALQVYRGDGAGGLANTTESFDVSAGYQTYTSRIAVDDFDGDGRADAVVAVSDPNDAFTRVSVLTGSGTTFAPRQIFDFASGHTGLHIADLDGDGDLDVLVALTGSTHILRNTGGALAPDGGVGIPPGARVGVGDFDGDGLLDVTGVSSDGAFLLRGVGGGSFARPRTAVLGSPRAIAAADLDSDGVADLVTTSEPGGTTVLRGLGGGAFARTDLAVPGIALAIANLNTDGNLDLVIGSSTSLQVMLGDGAGGFSPAFSDPAPALAIAVADFDEDGAADVAFADVDGLHLRRGANDGQLLARSLLYSSYQSCTAGACALAAFDFTRDGHADLAFANRGFNAHELKLLGGNGAGAFPSSGGFPNISNYPASEMELVAGDVLGDSAPDLVLRVRIPRSQSGNTTADWPDSTVVYENIGGAYGPLAYADSIGGSLWDANRLHAGVAIGDLNHDGKKDLVVNHTWAGAYLQVYGSSYNGSFETNPTEWRATGANPGGAVVADFDGDGWNDIATADRGSNGVTIIRGTAPSWSCYVSGSTVFADVGIETPTLRVATTTTTSSLAFEVDVIDAVPAGYLYAYGPGYSSPTEATQTDFTLYLDTNYYDLVQRCEIDFGDGSTPAPFDPCTYGINTTHTFPDGDPTDYTVTVTLWDEDSSATSPFTIPVYNVAPAVDPITTSALVEGAEIVLGSSIADVDGDAPWLVEWDFAYVPGSFTTDTAGDVAASGALTRTRAFDQGTHSIAMRVTDQAGTGGTALREATLVIPDAVPTLGQITPGSATVLESTPVSLDLPIDASAFDAVTECRWSFGDGSPVETDPGCAGLVDGTTSRMHAFADGEPTTFTVSVSVDDEDGTSTVSRQIAVLNAPAQASAGALSPASPAEGSPVSVDVSIAEAVDDAPYRVEWSWGDGSSEVTTHATTGVYSLSHTYADDGTYAFVARVIDQVDEFGNPQAGSAIGSAPLAVAVSNLPPSIVPFGVLDAVEGSLFLRAIAATDPAGGNDPLAFSLGAAPSGVTLLANGTIAWVPTYAQAGGGLGQSHSISVSVADGDGGADAGTFTVRVRWKDDDADGMADTWELAHGMDPTIDDSLGDADGDGIVNINEFNGSGPYTPNVVELSSPPENARVTSKDPALVAVNTTDPDSGSLVYQFEVFTDTTLSNRILQASAVGGTNGTTVLVVDDLTTDAGTGDDDPGNPANVELADDARYWWRARAFDGTFSGPWSSARSFDYQPVNDAPGAPAIASPLAGTHVSSTTPQLVVGNSIDPDDATLTYRFRLYSDAAMTALLSDSNAVTEGAFGTTSWLVPVQLSDDTPYWWSASATDGASTTATTGTFFVNLGNNEPSAPAVVSPADASTVVATAVDLVADPALDPDGQTLSYLFEIDVSPSFNTPARRTSTLQGGTTWNVADLLEDTTYYWRVRAHDGFAAGDWSLASFRVNTSNAAPSAPVPVGPVDQALLDDVTPTLRVRNAADAESDVLTYSFTVHEGAADGAIVASATGVAEGASGETTFAIPDAEPLARGTVYYWTATAADAGGAQSPGSTVAVFAVYKAPKGGGGGCSVSTTGASPMAALPAAVLAFVTLLRRRRKQA